MDMTRSSAKKAAFGGMLAAASLIFSYAETLIPLHLIIPIPGFKLGLANICVMLAAFYLGIGSAFWLTLVKCALTALLFGTPVSFLFSLGGGLLSFFFLFFVKDLKGKYIGYLGIAVACAALHNVGQVCVSALFFKDAAVFWYLEWLLPVSVITGIITGCGALAFERIVKTEK